MPSNFFAQLSQNGTHRIVGYQSCLLIFEDSIDVSFTVKGTSILSSKINQMKYLMSQEVNSEASITIKRALMSSYLRMQHF